jgi:hypothetical protein
MRLPILLIGLALGCNSEATSPRQATTQPNTPGNGNGVGGDTDQTTNTTSSAGMAGSGGASVAMDGTVGGMGGMPASAGAPGTAGGEGDPVSCPLGSNSTDPLPCRAEEEGQSCSFAIGCGAFCNSPCPPRLLPDAPEPQMIQSWSCHDGFWIAGSYPCLGAQYYTCECEADASAPAQDAGSSDAG